MLSNLMMFGKSLQNMPDKYLHEIVEALDAYCPVQYRPDGLSDLYNTSVKVLQERGK